MRIEKEVRNGGVTESGLRLVDKDDVSYHWITKQYGHPLFFLNDKEWVKVRMTVSDGYWEKNIAKNVRIINRIR